MCNESFLQTKFHTIICFMVLQLQTSRILSVFLSLEFSNPNHVTFKKNLYNIEKSQRTLIVVVVKCNPYEEILSYSNLRSIRS